MQLEIGIESSNDINEFGVCETISDLKYFITETFDRLFNKHTHSHGWSRGGEFNGYLIKKNNRYSGIYIEDVATFLDVDSPDFWGIDISDWDKSYYVDDFEDEDACFETGYNTVRNGVVIELKVKMSDDDIFEKIFDIVDFDLITAVKPISIILHPAYEQKAVEIFEWLGEFLNETYNAGLDYNRLHEVIKLSYT